MASVLAEAEGTFVDMPPFTLSIAEMLCCHLVLSCSIGLLTCMSAIVVFGCVPYSIDDLLRQMKDFVLGFNKKLGDIREVLSETISEAWDSENEIIQLSVVRILDCAASFHCDGSCCRYLYEGGSMGTIEAASHLN